MNATYRLMNTEPVNISVDGGPMKLQHVIHLTGTGYTLEEGGDFTFTGPKFSVRVARESVPFLRVEVKRLCTVMDLWAEARGQQ